MESVLACALLWDVDFCTGRDYRRALDACMVAEEDPRRLARFVDLDQCRDDRAKTANVASWLLARETDALNRGAFAQALFGGLERARQTGRLDPESFVIRGYALWIGLPAELQDKHPFVGLKEDFLKGPDDAT